MKRLFFLFLFFLLLSVNVYSKQLKVGVYLSLTGPIAAWGRPELEGIEIAHSIQPKVDGNNIKLMILDVASKQEEAALAAERFASLGVKYVIGPVSTSMAFSALPILERNKIVDVIPTANGMGLVKDRPYTSRVCITNNTQSKIMSNYIYTAGLKKGVIIEDITTEYSVDLTKRFKNDFIKDGGKILRIYKIQSSQKDFTPIITDIKKLNPDFIYFTNYYNTIALFLIQLRQMGLKQKVFAGSAASSYALIKIAGKNANGLVFTDDFDPLLPQGRLAKRFINDFENRFKRFPDSPEALAADSYFLLVRGIEKVGTNTQNVAKFIRNTTFYGVTGKIIIKNGTVRRTIVLREVKDGKFIPVAVYEP